MQNRSDKYISVRGVRVNNLKGVSLDIPRGEFIVVTGVSGSGKSSLAFNTLYAEGQRRYVESLSSYARQFLGRLDKPEADDIRGIPPAVAIEQRVSVSNARSTVGTSTEIYDFLRLLFTSIGKTISPVSGEVVSRDTVTDVTDKILSFPEGSRVVISALKEIPEGSDRIEILSQLKEQGFSRVVLDGDMLTIDEAVERELSTHGSMESFHIVIDRVAVHDDRENISRMNDSVQSAFYEGDGAAVITLYSGKEVESTHHFSNSFDMDGITFEEPSSNMFNFNNPLGACPVCEGYGSVIGIDEELVVPDSSLSLYDGAVACWRGESNGKLKAKFITSVAELGFPIHTPYYKLDQSYKDLLWHGDKSKKIYGIDHFFKYLEKKIYKIQNRVMISRYRGRATCLECNGKRLKKSSDYVTVGGYKISELIELPISKLQELMNNFPITDKEREVVKRVFGEILRRVDLLTDIGLGYLNLNRPSATLSGGESQRINLIKSIGSSLVGALYILDEPSIGLHPRDNLKLIETLHKLKDQGNTVLVVEHDAEIMRRADHIIDIGPFAGQNGGEVVFEGSYNDIISGNKGITSDYLSGRSTIKRFTPERGWKNYIRLLGARANNLKSVDVDFPLNVMTVVTGVSGSGKSTLINNILYPALARIVGEYNKKPGAHTSLEGDIDMVKAVEYLNQSPIGKSSRSNPATYLKAYDEIRKLFSEQKRALAGNIKPSHFSFNVDGGRCPHCKGEGTITVEMQFMADLELVCEDCKGKRFRDEILDITYRGKSVSDVLNMTIDSAIEFFGETTENTEKRIIKRLTPLQSVGLGYLTLGQSSSSLSGGENQRVKLASFLSKERSAPTLFMFDEPTTGLHFHDINILIKAFDALIDRGHTVLIIEHNIDVIKCADHIIDLGPGGGDEGGNIVCCGTLSEVTDCKESYTGEALREELLRE